VVCLSVSLSVVTFVSPAKTAEIDLAVAAMRPNTVGNSKLTLLRRS